MAKVHCRAAKIIIDNSALLDKEHHKRSLKVHIDRTRDDGKWTMSRVEWVPGTSRNDDEYDDDINRGYFEHIPLKNCVLDDVWDALAVKEAIIEVVASARQREFAFEHVLAVSAQDLQPGFGEDRPRGYHTAMFDDRL
ncbi:MAG: hypothetical protein GX970_05460 [Phyllobacteriaceae bacterium]|nr:hypothetical protein [Phyllobacteriaceae bacterium]